MAKEIATKTKLDTRIAADIAAAMPVANQPAAVKAAAAPALAKKAIVIDTEEVQAVHNSIREAKRKSFSAIITDHVVWDTDPQRNEFSPPLVPQTKAEMEEQNRNYQRQQEMERAAKASNRYALAGQQAGGFGVMGSALGNFRGGS